MLKSVKLRRLILERWTGGNDSTLRRVQAGLGPRDGFPVVIGVRETADSYFSPRLFFRAPDRSLSPPARLLAMPGLNGFSWRPTYSTLFSNTKDAKPALFIASH